MLYEEDGKLPLDMIEEVSFQNRLKNSDIAHYVVFDSGLFEHDEKFFWSERQRRDELKINEISEARRAAGKAGGLAKRSNCQANANQMPSNKQNDINTTTSSSKDSEVRPLLSERTQDDSQETLLDFGASGEDKELHQPESTSQNIASSPAVLTPHQCQNIADSWNRTVDEYKAVLPKVKTLGEDRIKKIRVRWKEFAEIGDPVEVMRVVFRNACSSKFFQEGSWGTFDWIFTNSKNWAKVYEGNYNDKSKGEVVPQEQPKPKKTYNSIQEQAAAEGWG